MPPKRKAALKANAALHADVGPQAEPPRKKARPPSKKRAPPTPPVEEAPKAKAKAKAPSKAKAKTKAKAEVPPKAKAKVPPKAKAKAKAPPKVKAPTIPQVVGADGRPIPIPDAPRVLGKKGAKEKEDKRKLEVVSKPPVLPNDILEAFPEDFTWHNQPQHLGGGGYGQAHLWLAVDAKQRIVERIVVKDCWVDIDTWGSSNHWIGNPHNPDEREHREIYFHQIIHPNGQYDREGAEYLAKMIHSESFPDEMAYRLYLQYYPHGDLKQVIKRYQAVMEELDERKEKAEKKKKAALKAAKVTAKAKGKAAGTKRKIDEVDEEQDEEEAVEPTIPIIPEPFLWHVLEALCRACIVLEHGSTDEASMVRDWHPIVHRDIKPDNIFLDAPLPTIFPSYPKPVLADFGVAIKTFDGDRRNPLDYLGWDATETWESPEMMPLLDRETLKLSPVGRLEAHTNVWGIGGIVIALMNRSKSLVGTSVTAFSKGDSQPEIDEDMQERYSQELQDLVLQCTRYWPEERIGLRMLLERIQSHTGDGGDDGSGPGKRGKKGKGTAGDDLAQGMRYAKHDDRNLELEFLWQGEDRAALEKLVHEALADLASPETEE